jgi:hypothetical protein
MLNKIYSDEELANLSEEEMSNLMGQLAERKGTKIHKPFVDDYGIAHFDKDTEPELYDWATFG